jgi:chemotaxis protein MotB
MAERGMSAPDHAAAPQIIIVRRKRGGDHDAHHGGVWKIAYADFVTAMMAFFLVMWLINASNEETKAAVASYFNPVQLMDTTSNPKGMRDAQYGASSRDTPADQDMPRARSDARPAKGGRSDENAASTENGAAMDDSIFRDPYAVLAEIAGGKGAGAEGERANDQGEAGEASPDGRPGQLGGAAFRDPFDPQFWAERRSEISAAAKQAADAGGEVAQPIAETIPRAPEEPSEAETEVVADAEPLTGPEPDPATGSPADAMTESPDNPAAAAAADEMPSPEVAADVNDDVNDDVSLAETIAQSINETLAETPGQKPAFDVTPIAGGVTINLTDEADFSMFELGSARPRAEVIALIERLAARLRQENGTIEIAGHTDARPFLSGAYDNWRLSSARAQIAYHMLVRAGIDPQRIVAVTGHAERKPKNADDPLAAENRRIEIRLMLDRPEGRNAG